MKVNILSFVSLTENTSTRRKGRLSIIPLSDLRFDEVPTVKKDLTVTKLLLLIFISIYLVQTSVLPSEIRYFWDSLTLCSPLSCYDHEFDQ